MAARADLTDLINRALAGDQAASGAAFGETYDDLRRLARARLSAGARGAQLDTHDLVHESFLRFVKSGRVEVADRRHFLRYAGRVMRSVIVDLVRERNAQRRGGDQLQVTLSENIAHGTKPEDEILWLHEALKTLEAHSEQMAQVVELRYYAGLTEPEIADVLGVTDRTVRRIWQRARIWLADAMG